MEGKILKANTASSPIVRQEVLQAADEAKAILTEAQEIRERILREAQEHGFRLGFEQWESAIREAQQSAERYTQQHREDILRLSMRIAEKILGEALLERPERMVGIVHEALRNLSRERRLTIEVAPGFGALLETHRVSLQARLGPECSLCILESSEIQAGGCLLRSELGTIDARIETQIKLLERALLANLGGNAPLTGAPASKHASSGDSQ